MKILNGTLLHSFLPLVFFTGIMIVIIFILDTRAESIVKQYEDIEILPPVTGETDLKASDESTESIMSVSDEKAESKNPALLKARELETLGFSDQALEVLLKALEEVQKLNDPKDEDLKKTLITKIGMAYSKTGKYKEAEMLFTQIIEENKASEFVYFNRALMFANSDQPEKAKGDYEKALTLRPTYFEAMFNLGLIKLDEKDYKSAQALFEKATLLSSGLSKAKAFFALGQSWERLSNYEKAKKAYIKSIEYHPAYLRPRYNLALLAIDQRGREGEEEANKYLNEIDRLNPNFAPANFLRGRLASKNGDDNLALDWYLKAGRLDPAFYNAKYNAGLTAMRLGQFSLAQGIFIHLRDDFPEKPETEFNLGQLAYKEKKFEKALEHFEKALQMSSGNYIEAQNNIGLVLKSLGRFQEALSVFDALLKTKPNSPSTLVNKALILMNQKNFEEAEASLTEALKYNPDQVSALYNLGKLETIRKQYAKAEKAYENVLKLKPEHLKARLNLGIVASKLKKYDVSVDSYNQVIKISPDYVPAHYNLAVIYRKQKKYDEAIKEYEKVLELDKEHTGTLLNLGVLFGKTGKFEAAIELFNKSLDYDPGNYKTRFNLGLQLVKINRLDEAEKEFKKVLQINSQYVPAIRSLADLLYKKGNKNEASALMKRVIEIEPDNNNNKKILELYQ